MTAKLTSAHVHITFGWNWLDTQDVGSNTTNNGAYAIQATFANGTGSGQANLYPIPDVYTVDKSGSQTIDLVGALKDFAGNTTYMSKLKGVLVSVTSNSKAGSINFTTTIPGLIADATTPLTVYKGGMIAVSVPDGLTVTAKTQDELVLINGDPTNAAEVAVVVFGVGTLS